MVIPREVSIELGGADAAMASGAVFTLRHWTFEKDEGRILAAPFNAGEYPGWSAIADAIAGEWLRCCQAAGLYGTTNLSLPEFVAARAALRCVFTLSTQACSVLRTALTASYLEFTDNWWEFSMVTSGHIELYGLKRDDLLRIRQLVADAQASLGSELDSNSALATDGHEPD